MLLSAIEQDKQIKGEKFKMIPREYNIEGKVAIVTGAGRGIGKAIALTLAEAGVDITAVARTKEEIEQTAKEVRQLGQKALAIPTDVTQEAQVKRVIEQTLSEFGKIDILVNNAGTTIDGLITFVPGTKPSSWQLAGDIGDKQMTSEDWRRVIETNLTSAFLFAQAVGPHMIKQKSGKVINITSIYATMGIPYNSVYCTTKGGLVTFTQCLAAEWGPFNICVNAIGPGYIKTKMTEPLWDDPKLLKELLNVIPKRRLGEPREVALLVIYLASEASDFMTGQTIYIDGGQIARGTGVI